MVRCRRRGVVYMGEKARHHPLIPPRKSLGNPRPPRVHIRSAIRFTSGPPSGSHAVHLKAASGYLLREHVYPSVVFDPAQSSVEAP